MDYKTNEERFAFLAEQVCNNSITDEEIYEILSVMAESILKGDAEIDSVGRYRVYLSALWESTNLRDVRVQQRIHRLAKRYGWYVCVESADDEECAIEISISTRKRDGRRE